MMWYFRYFIFRISKNHIAPIERIETFDLVPGEIFYCRKNQNAPIEGIETHHRLWDKQVVPGKNQNAPIDPAEACGAGGIELGC